MQKLQSNIGTLDRYVRLTTGLLALGAGSSMRRASLMRTLLMSYGAMKIAEGVTGWCPVVHLAERMAPTRPDAQDSANSQRREESRGEPQPPEVAHANQGQSQTGRDSDSRHEPDPTHTREAALERQSDVNGQGATSAHTHDGRTHSLRGLPQ